MTRKKYLKRMKQHDATLDRLWAKIVVNTVEFMETNSDNHKFSQYSEGGDQIDKFIDSLCLKGAWIRDRTDGRIATTHNPTYRGSLTKKIRKALGYNI